MMKQKEILQPFASSVNNIITVKNLNAIAFFLPTDGEERIECINPVVVPKDDIDKIYKTLDDITKQFSIGEKFDNLSDDDIEVSN
jgi:hypothetical protein